MRKFLLTLCALTSMLLLCTITAMAKSYTIPQCAVPPTIDGKMSKDEYYGAYHKFMNNDKGNYDYSTHPDQSEQNKLDQCKGYDFYMYWYDDPEESGEILDVKKGGLYICVVAKDKSLGAIFSDGAASNASDCIQILIDPLNLRMSSNSKAFCFDFSPETKKSGKSLIYEHFQFCSKPPETFNYQVKAHRDKNGYTMEIFIPWSLLSINNRLPRHRVGTQMGIGIIAMDWVGQSPYYNITDFGGGKSIENIVSKPRYYNTVTFGETVYPPGYKPNGDLTKLKEAIEKAEKLLPDEKLYVPAAFASFKLALESAKQMTTTDKQAEIDEALKDLEEAMTALKKLEDLTPFEALQAAIEAAKQLKEADYHPETWERLKKALESAEKITDKNPESEIKEATDELNVAINGLVSIDEDISELRLENLLNAIKNFEMLNEKDYTAESWKTAVEAYEKAKSLQSNKEAVQFEVDEASKVLENAIKALVSVNGENNKNEITESDKKDGLSPFAWVAIAVVVIAAIIAIVIVLKRKDPKKAEQENKDEKIK